MIEKLSQITKQTDELKKLILENPDLPLIIDVETDLCSDDSYTSWIAPGVRCYLGEVLDCEQDVNEERIYLNRIEFEEELEEYLYDKYDGKINGEDATAEEWNAFVEKVVAKYDPCWQKCIVIFAET